MAVATSQTTMQLALAGEITDIDLAVLQGFWSAEQYLRLSVQTNRLIEFAAGEIEVLPMPTRRHQLIVRWLFVALFAHLQRLGGLVLFALMRLQTRPGGFREPDILLLLQAEDPRNQEAFWLGADLVVEVVSPDDPERDTVTKREEYAAARIPEYWIVNPLDETVTVLTLAGEQYAEHGVFRRGERAGSQLLDGFAASVDELFDV